MIIKNIEEITIFESPDGGKTIYSRKSGDPTMTRTLVREDPEKKDRERWLEWRDILKQSKDNPTLADAIHQAETIWNLIKNKK